MTAKRILSGLLIFLMAAAGLVLLKPDLFPDITLPQSLANAPRERSLLGALLAGVSGLVLIGMSLARGRHVGRQAAALSAGPIFDDDGQGRASEPSWAFNNDPAKPDEPLEGANLRLVEVAATEPLPLADAEQQPIGQVEPEQGAQSKSEPVASTEASDSARRDEEPAVEEEPDHAEISVASPEVINQPEVVAGLGGEAEPSETPEAANDGDAAPSDQQQLLSLVRDAEAAQSAGRQDDALGLYDKALSKARSIYEADPADPGAQLTLAETLSRIASLEEAEDRKDVALQRHEEALGLHRAVAGAEPDNADYGQGLSQALVRVAEARAVQGQGERAQELYAEAAKVAERLAWRHPGEERFAGLLSHIRRRQEAVASQPADLEA